MAFPTRIDGVTRTFTTGTAHNAALMTTVNTGDRVIAMVLVDSSATITTPSGWNLIISSANGSACRLAWYYRNATGSEGGNSHDWVTSASEAVVVRYERIQAGTYDPATAPGVSTAATGNDEIPNPGAATASWGSADNLFFCGYSIDWPEVLTGSNGTAPTNYTSYTEFQTGTGSGDAGGAIAFRQLASNTDNPGTFATNSGFKEEWVSHTLVMRPAVASTETVTHTTDAIIYQPGQAFHTTDATIQDTATVDHDTDAVVILIGTASLYATGDQGFTDVVNENDTTTNLYQSVDDDPDSPSDSDWINNSDVT